MNDASQFGRGAPSQSAATASSKRVKQLTAASLVCVIALAALGFAPFRSVTNEEWFCSGRHVPAIAMPLHIGAGDCVTRDIVTAHSGYDSMCVGVTVATLVGVFVAAVGVLLAKRQTQRRVWSASHVLLVVVLVAASAIPAAVATPTAYAWAFVGLGVVAIGPQCAVIAVRTDEFSS